MKPAKTSALLVSGLLLWGLAGPVLADETGLANMHEQRRVSGKACFSDHVHSGSSSGERSRAAALRDAIYSWRNFTDFEYGSDWANYNKAVGKRVGCSGSGGDWGCTVEATPCR